MPPAPPAVDALAQRLPLALSRHIFLAEPCAIIAAGVSVAMSASSAVKDSLIGHWRLEGRARDASPSGLHAQSHDVAWNQRAGAEFNGRSAYLEVPASPLLNVGTNDFTVSLWLRLDPTLDDSPGDLVTLFDPEARNGFNLTVQHQSGACSSMANTRNLFFGLDAGTQPRWINCGRPGNNLMVYALTVFQGALYAGTFEHGVDEAGHVYRYAGGTNWMDCGMPDRCNTVSALAVCDGELYAGVASYSGAGSLLKPSPNTHPGGRVYRYAGGTRWVDCGRVCDAEVIWGMTVFQGKLHVTAMDLPPKTSRPHGRDCIATRAGRTGFGAVILAGGWPRSRRRTGIFSPAVTTAARSVACSVTTGGRTGPTSAHRRTWIKPTPLPSTVAGCTRALGRREKCFDISGRINGRTRAGSGANLR